MVLMQTMCAKISGLGLKWNYSLCDLTRANDTPDSLYADQLNPKETLLFLYSCPMLSSFRHCIEDAELMPHNPQ